MSAFKFEGKIPVSAISASRLIDTDKMKNAFAIEGPLIERIVAICQSSSEANKWVDLLAKNVPSAIDIKRNTSFTSGAHLPNVSIYFQFNFIYSSTSLSKIIFKNKTPFKDQQKKLMIIFSVMLIFINSNKYS